MRECKIAFTGNYLQTRAIQMKIQDMTNIDSIK